MEGTSSRIGDSSQIGDAALRVVSSSGPMSVDDLHIRTGRLLGAAVSDQLFKEALRALSEQQTIRVESFQVKLSEPDFPERDLEDQVEKWLFGPNAFEALRLARDDAVVQKTTVGGRQGSGLWSRPDFTIATVRRRKYDPWRRLDVLAFELKNLAGTSLLSVHEALAHTRFAHYAYLVCPLSKLAPERSRDIQQNCVSHGIGMISFQMAIDGGKPRLGDFTIEVPATRKSPDPDIVDRYIDDRMTADNAQRLLQVGRGG